MAGPIQQYMLKGLRRPRRTVLASAFLTGDNTSPDYANPETSVYLSRFNVPPSQARQYAVDVFISSLKASGCFALLDVLYIAQGDGQAYRQNVIQNLYNSTVINSPSYVADRGYAGDGSSSYLDTGFNASTAVAPKFTANDAHIGVYSLSNSSLTTDQDLGNNNTGPNASIIVPRSSNGNSLRGSVNTTTPLFFNFGANTDSLGNFSIHRQASATTLAGYINGVNIGSVASNSGGGVGSQNFTLLKVTSSYSTRRIAAARIGASFSDAQETAFHAALTTYLHAIGAI